MCRSTNRRLAVRCFRFDGEIEEWLTVGALANAANGKGQAGRDGYLVVSSWSWMVGHSFVSEAAGLGES